MRMLALMKGLDLLGYSMDLLTVHKSVALVDNNMDEFEFLNRVNIIFTGQSKLYETTVSNKGRLIGGLTSVLRKLYHMFSLYDHTKKIAKGVSIKELPSKDYDYIIAVSDPKTTHLALQSLLDQGLKAKKIIQYWGDPMYGDVTQKAILPSFIIKREELSLLSLADKIVYTSPLTLEEEKTIYPNISQKMVCIPTANASQKIYPDPGNEIYTVGYYGGYKSTVRNIMPLYDAFRNLKGTAKLNLVGDSDLDLSSTENVMVKPRGVVKELEEKTDLFVCVLNSSGTQIPGKIYHMAATNRPILVVLDGDMKDQIAEYLKTFNRYVTCENKAEDIEAAIRNIMNDDRAWMPCEKLEPKQIAKEILR